MKQNDIEYDIHECCGCEENTCKKCIRNSAIIVQTSDKDLYKVYPHEILYIAIEGRKSVLYLTDRKVDNVTKELVNMSCGDEKYSVYTSKCKIGAFKKAFLNFGKR